MLKRLIAAPLWFLSVWMTVELLNYFVGGPRIVAPIMAGAVALFVAADPFRLIWAKSGRPDVESTDAGGGQSMVSPVST
jgi:hypothetical protein